MTVGLATTTANSARTTAELATTTAHSARTTAELAATTENSAQTTAGLRAMTAHLQSAPPRLLPAVEHPVSERLPPCDLTLCLAKSLSS
jgi:hypothetical protein